MVRVMSASLKKSYMYPESSEEDKDFHEGLMVILLQTKDDVAGMVVQALSEKGMGWGNDSLELRQVKQVEYTQKVYEIKCDGK